MTVALVAAAFGAAIGAASGTRPRHLGRPRLRGGTLLAAGLVMRLAATFGEGDDLGLLLIGATAALLAFAALNLHLPGVPVVALGLVLNLAVLAANDAMPVRASALVDAGAVEASEVGDVRLGAGRELERPGHHLTALGDVVPVPPLREVVSIGDLVVAAGLVPLARRVAWSGWRTRRRTRATADRPEPAGHGREEPAVGDGGPALFDQDRPAGAAASTP